MNHLPVSRQTAILHCFAEGNSIRSSARLSGVSPATCLALQKRAGAAALKIHNRYVWDVPCTVIEADEIWTYLRIKREHIRFPNAQQVAGDIWLWVALCPKTKLVVSWKLGNRDIVTGTAFMRDLRSRIGHRFQLSTDGLDAYLQSVEAVFGTNIDYARKVTLVNQLSGLKSTVTQIVSGNPVPENIGTSFVERFNGTFRNTCRRYFRRSLAFSKTMQNHELAVALNMFAYNFCHVHGSLRVTPAMAAGLTDHIWTMDELLQFVD